MNMRTVSYKWLCAAPAILALAALSPAAAGEIRVPFPSGNVTVEEDAQGYALFGGEDIGFMSRTGEPALPYRLVTVLLPPAADPASVTASVENAVFEEVTGSWDVRPAGAPATWDGERVVTVWPEDRTIVDGRDAAVYGSDSLFPPDILAAPSAGSLRGWKLASAPVALYRYNPARKKLLRLTGCDVSFGYLERKASLPARSPASDPLASRRIQGRAVNFDGVAPLYGTGLKTDGGPAGTTYVVITTSALESALTNLDRFTVNKEARGFTVQVVTEGTWGGGAGNAAAENIRSWLESNYASMNIEYVLLIGNPNPSTGDVPMKYCYPYSGGCPTDYYYCDLTGDWDRDGDGAYGEPDPTGIDRYWEVLVGRIPYYGSTEDVDTLLDKIIEYENTEAADASWRENVLLSMVRFSGTCLMYELGEELKDDAISPNGWSYHRVYESSYGLSPAPETVGATTQNTTDAWNGAQFGAVIWATHGWETGASNVMDLSRAATLDDDHPSFTYQGSCSNSHPETTNNLAYSILQNGGIATVGATRTSWYTYPATSYKGTGTIGGVGYEYGYRLIADDASCGEALCDLKQDVPYVHNWCWQNYIVFNLYGDPSLSLSTTLVDDDADTMPDWWEITHFGDISQAAGDDFDSDNLTNLEEYGQGTDPKEDDCDGDGLDDGDEVHTHSTDPLDPDSDDDGLEDGDEVAEGADPNDTDSDDDSLLDGEEMHTYGTSPTDADTDGDDWCDVLEISGGSDPNDPNDPPPGSAPDMLRISFQPDGSSRPNGYAPSCENGYTEDFGYGWL